VGNATAVVIAVATLGSGEPKKQKQGDYRALFLLLSSPGLAEDKILLFVEKTY